jgi:predicted HicB family RNase H-like nuclease
LYFVLHYICTMKTKRSLKKPPAKQPKGYAMQVRLNDEEGAAFESAAKLAGVSLSAWVRERLRTAARSELSEAGKPVPFLH